MLGNFEKILNIFDENSFEKLNFFIFNVFEILFFENLLLKIDPSEITPVFYNIFMGVWGGDFPPGYELARGGCLTTYLTPSCAPENFCQ